MIATALAGRYTTILADANSVRHHIADVDAESDAFGPDVKKVIRRTVLEHGRSFTQTQFVEIAESGRWKATLNSRTYP